MSFRNTICIHYNYDSDAVKDVMDILARHDITDWHGKYGGDTDSFKIFFDKQFGGCNFEYFWAAADICRYLRDNKKDMAVSMYLDECDVFINIYKVEDKFMLAAISKECAEETDVTINDINKAIEYLED